MGLVMDILMGIKSFQENERFISLGIVYTEWVNANKRKEEVN